MPTNIIERALADLKREFPGIDGTIKGIVFSVFFLSNHLVRSGSRILEEFDLSWGEYLVLSTIRRRGAHASMSPSAISESLGMSTGGVSNLLRRMEERCLIKRVPSSRDRRAIRVQITTEGRKYAEATLNRISASQAEQFEILSEAKRARLNATFCELVAHLASQSASRPLLKERRATHTPRR